MEFNEKLQELRRQKGLTQEELAGHLFVTRAAVSKWESGRGYPSIDSLKALSKFFSISLDDLLSADELVTLAEEDQTAKQFSVRTMALGLLDCGYALYFILPLFSDRSNELIRGVPLFSMTAAPYIKIICTLFVVLIILWGILQLVLHKSDTLPQPRVRELISYSLSSAVLLAFIALRQPYAAAFSYFLTLAKLILLRKKP